MPIVSEFYLLQIPFLSFEPELVSIVEGKRCFLETVRKWLLFSKPICEFVTLYWGIETIDI